MNEQLLEEIGLTKGETKVYLTLLKTGETTTGKIIEYSGLSSGKIYEILDKLIKKGLASFIIKEKTKYFQASSPRRILDFLNEKEKNLEVKKKEIEKELPLLLGMQKPQVSETVLFKGLKGIQTAIFQGLDSLKRGDAALAMGLRTGKDEKYNILWEKWHHEREKRKIVCKCIFSDNLGDYYKFFKKLRFTEVRVLKGLTPSAIDIMGDKVLIFTYGEEPSCLYIDNKEIAESFKSFFELLWKIAKK